MPRSTRLPTSRRLQATPASSLRSRGAAALSAVALGASLVAVSAPASATPIVPDAPKAPVAIGSGGAVASVDEVASQVGLDVLAAGGNAADAAVATAAALGVTEPYSAGIGGGGFLVYYDAGSGEVTTIDGRETAPATFTENVFTDGAGAPLNFASVVSSGLSVGVPGTPALWDKAASELGTQPLRELLKPAEAIARRGFVVDATFAEQTAGNAARFSRFPATAEVYLPGGEVPVVGSTFRNPDLARAYRELGTRGVESLYEGGRLGRAVAAEASDPTTVDGVEVFDGQLTAADLAAYQAIERDPTLSDYRGLTVAGMPVPSSGGIAVGETLNLLESQENLTGEALADVGQVQYLHRFAEASSTAFADRNRWIGDVADVPVEALLSQGFADARTCQLFSPTQAAARPIPFGDPATQTGCGDAAAVTSPTVDDKGTTHLTVADAEGNVASYTLTIESTGGSGITVPGYGFLLNNELTDFNFAPATEGVTDPNLPGPGKRPRSSMAPTIVLDDGAPVLALGSPGGATIITTVAQVITGYLDRDLALVDAIAAPRLSSRNGTSSQAEAGITDTAVGAGLTAAGHVLAPTAEIGAASAIAVLPDGRFEAAAETVRRGGGSARVVVPD